MVKVETNDLPEYPVVMRWLVTGSINLLETGPQSFNAIIPLLRECVFGLSTNHSRASLSTPR
jgi:hypothetical protein